MSGFLTKTPQDIRKRCFKLERSKKAKKSQIFSAVFEDFFLPISLAFLLSIANQESRERTPGFGTHNVITQLYLWTPQLLLKWKITEFYLVICLVLRYSSVVRPLSVEENIVVYIYLSTLQNLDSRSRCWAEKVAKSVRRNLRKRLKMSYFSWLVCFFSSLNIVCWYPVMFL